MTAVSLVQVLEDTAKLAELAKGAGISIAQARRLAAALADIPVEQALRICATAHVDHVRQTNRMTRKTQGGRDHG